MSSPDDGSETRPASERSTSGTGTGTGVSAPRGNDVVTSPGTSRTPPPRGRRGAPPSRTAAPDLVEPEPAVAVVPAPAPTAKTKTKTTTAKTTTSRGGPKPAPGSSKAFDWDIDDPSPAPAPTAVGAAATVAMTTGAAEVAEPEAPSGRPEPRARKTKAAKRPERRFRQTIQKVDLWSVTKIALCFYVSAMAVLMVSLVALWVVADSAGIIDNVENFVGDLFSSEDFQFVSGQVLRGAVLGGVVLVALMVVLTIIGASFYNIFAELFGGIEIVIREEEQPPKR